MGYRGSYQESHPSQKTRSWCLHTSRPTMEARGRDCSMRSTRRVVLAAALVAASSLLGSKAVGAPHNPSASMPDSVAWHEAAYAYIRTQTSVHWCNQNGCSFTAGCPSDARIEHFTTGASARMKRGGAAVGAPVGAGAARPTALCAS